MKKRLFLLILSVFCICSVCVFPADTSDEIDRQLKDGILLLGVGDYQDALGKFLRAEELDSLDANAHYYLGMTYSKIGEFEKSVSSYKRALALNPQLGEVHFQLAVVYYQAKQYTNALEELREAEEYTPEDVMVFYYRGLVYYEMKKYYRSAPQFRKMRDLDAEFEILSYYWEGVSLFNQGLYKKAEYNFQEIKRISPDSQVGSSAEEFLQTIEKHTKNLVFDAGLGLEYDDNVTLKPLDEDAATISDKEDWRGVINLGLTGRTFTELGQLAGGYSFYQSLHEDLTDYNVQDHTVFLSFSSDSRPVQPFIRYSYDYCLVDNDKYFEKHTVFPALNITFASPHTTQPYVQYENTHYFDSPDQDEQNRTGHTNTIGCNQYFSIMEDEGYVKIGGAYKNDNTKGDDWDSWGYKAAAALNIPIELQDTDLELGCQYENTNFVNEDSSFDKKRKDNNLNSYLKITHKIDEYWDISLSYSHTANNSNIDFYEYNRNITSLFANFTF